MLPLLQRASINLPPCWEPLPPLVDCRPHYCSRVPQHGPAACVCHLWFISAPLLTLSYKHTYTPTNYTLQTCTKNRLAFRANTKLVLFRRLLMVVVLFMKSAGRWQQDNVSLGSRNSWCSHTVWQRQKETQHTYTHMYTGPPCQSDCLCKAFDVFWWNFKNIYLTFKAFGRCPYPGQLTLISRALRAELYSPAVAASWQPVAQHLNPWAKTSLQLFNVNSDDSWALIEKKCDINFFLTNRWQ